MQMYSTVLHMLVCTAQSLVVAEQVMCAADLTPPQHFCMLGCEQAIRLEDKSAPRLRNLQLDVHPCDIYEITYLHGESYICMVNAYLMSASADTGSDNSHAYETL